jgi:hypothetical protein
MVPEWGTKRRAGPRKGVGKGRPNNNGSPGEHDASCCASDTERPSCPILTQLMRSEPR